MSNTKMIAACEKYGVQPDAARMRFRSLFPQGDFDRNAEYAQEVIDAVFAKEIGKAGAKKSDPQNQNTGEAKRENVGEKTGEKRREKTSETKKPKKPLTKMQLFCYLLFSCDVLHGLMLIVEGFSLYGFAGLFGSGAIFAVTLAALIISGDPLKVRTSANAVGACAFLYAAAGVVHYEHFTSIRPNAFYINIGWASVIPVVAFICLFLYRDVNND